jgi:hypothetical protein
MDHAPLAQSDFKEGEERFHKLVLMYDELIRHFKANFKHFVSEERDKYYGLEIRITKRDASTSREFIKYVTTGGRSDWMWYRTWDKHYRNA